MLWYITHAQIIYLRHYTTVYRLTVACWSIVAYGFVMLRHMSNVNIWSDGYLGKLKYLK